MWDCEAAVAMPPASGPQYTPDDLALRQIADMSLTWAVRHGSRSMTLVIAEDRVTWIADSPAGQHEMSTPPVQVARQLIQYFLINYRDATPLLIHGERGTVRAVSLRHADGKSASGVRVQLEFALPAISRPAVTETVAYDAADLYIRVAVTSLLIQELMKYSHTVELHLDPEPQLRLITEVDRLTPVKNIPRELAQGMVNYLLAHFSRPRNVTLQTRMSMIHAAPIAENNGTRVSSKHYDVDLDLKTDPNSSNNVTIESIAVLVLLAAITENANSALLKFDNQSTRIILNTPDGEHETVPPPPDFGPAIAKHLLAEYRDSAVILNGTHCRVTIAEQTVHSITAAKRTFVITLDWVKDVRPVDFPFRADSFPRPGFRYSPDDQLIRLFAYTLIRRASDAHARRLTLISRVDEVQVEHRARGLFKKTTAAPPIPLLLGDATIKHLLYRFVHPVNLVFGHHLLQLVAAPIKPNPARGIFGGANVDFKILKIP